MTNLPEYAEKKRKGNIGEAYVQYVLSQFCIVHSIDGSNDIGNDFICELIKGTSPTNLLFYVQVKYHKSEPRISKKLIEYWKGSPIPVFLFWVKDRNGSIPPSSPGDYSRSVSYKRYTPIVHNEQRHKNEKFKPYDEHGFKEDLIKDYIRTQYNAGFSPVIKPRDFLQIDEKIIMGLGRHILLVKDVIFEYERNILERGWSNFLVTAILLKRRGGVENILKAKKSIELAKELLMDLSIDEREQYLRKIENVESEINTELRKN